MLRVNRLVASHVTTIIGEPFPTGSSILLMLLIYYRLLIRLALIRLRKGSSWVRIERKSVVVHLLFF